MGTNNDATNDDVRTTTEHALVRKLVEDRDGYPAHLAESEGEGDRGLLRIGFADADEPELTEISREQFFGEFEGKDLAFAYREGGKEEEPFTYLRRREERS